MIKNNSIADIFPQDDYLAYLILYMSGGMLLPDQESDNVDKELGALRQRLNKNLEDFTRMCKLSSNHIRNCYLWFTRAIKGDLGAATKLLRILRCDSHKKTMEEGVPDAESFIDGIEMLLDESEKEVDINYTLETMLNLTFSKYYRNRGHRYIVNKKFSPDMPSIPARQDEMAYLFFSLVLPIRAIREVALTVSTELISDGVREYIEVTLRISKEISLENVIEDGKDTGVGFELAKKIVKGYGSIIDVRWEAGENLTFIIRLSAANTEKEQPVFDMPLESEKTLCEIMA